MGVRSYVQDSENLTNYAYSSLYFCFCRQLRYIKESALLRKFPTSKNFLKDPLKCTLYFPPIRVLLIPPTGFCLTFSPIPVRLSKQRPSTAGSGAEVFQNNFPKIRDMLRGPCLRPII